MKLLLSIAIIFALFFSIFTIFNPLGSKTNEYKKEMIVLNSDRSDVATLNLQENGYIKSFTAFSILYFFIGEKKLEPGGYYLSKSMNSWEIINELNSGADLKQITFPEGLRKEQIGERLAKLLNWSENETKKWNNEYTTFKPEYVEGVYFPDTYLIPVEENGALISARMINNFNTKLEKYFLAFEEKNIKWTTAIKIASLIEREAGSESDMPLIAGVIWNRLENGEKLDIDATIQYAKGKQDGQWWSVVTGADIRNVDSPYNTYKYRGLPPTPISNPGLASINAVLNPTETDCIFYLHDRNREIHCSITYKEHLENIEKYLN